MNPITVGSLFAGIGGICHAFNVSGAKVIWANEFDKKASITYRLNFGSDYLIEDDIINVKSKDIPEFDILTAGFPCQAFSIAGHGNGFDDERGNLFFEITRILRDKQPKAFLLENVKNLVTHDKGRTFKLIQDSLKSENYYFSHKVLSAVEHGNLPQTRERTLIVGFKNKNDFDAFQFPEKTKLTKTIHDIVNTSDKKEGYFYYPEDHHYYQKLKEAMVNRNTIYQWRRKYVRENQSNACPTLTANMGTGGHNVPLIIDDYGFRKLTPRETLSFQGFPHDFKIPEDMARSHIYKQAGNSVPVPVIQRVAARMIQVLNSNEPKAIRWKDLENFKPITQEIYSIRK